MKAKLKALRIITIIPLVAVIIGCTATMGEKHLEDDQVVVTVGPDILQDSEKLETLQKLEIVEQLHLHIKRYLRKRFKKWNVRRSLKIYVTITHFNIGTFSNKLGAEILVEENGKELKRFTQVVTRTRFQNYLWGGLLMVGGSVVGDAGLILAGGAIMVLPRKSAARILAGYIYKRTAHLADDHISITIGPDILQNSQKLETLQKYQTVEKLYRNVRYKFNKEPVRKSLTFDITITGFQLYSTKHILETDANEKENDEELLKSSRDILEVDVIVKENGEELQRFTNVEAGQDAGKWNVEQSSEALAERLYEQIKDL